MAYASTNPPFGLVPRVGGGPGNIWGYNSTHSIADVAASGFVANGSALGLKVGDAFLATVLSTAGAYTAHSNGRVSSVTASSAATIIFASSST